MGNSRKYPYSTMGDIIALTPTLLAYTRYTKCTSKDIVQAKCITMITVV